MKTPSGGEGAKINRASWLSLHLGGDPLQGGINAQLSLLRSYADITILAHLTLEGNYLCFSLRGYRDSSLD